jgi:hypothetical protein
MERPEPVLSPSERIMLVALAQEGGLAPTFDWLALQRLRFFGFVEETERGPKITDAGRRAVGSAGPQR